MELSTPVTTQPKLSLPASFPLKLLDTTQLIGAPPVDLISGWTILSKLDTVSAESDLWVVENTPGHYAILKLYRRGIVPALPANLLQSLNHPNVVQTFQTGETHGHFYEIVELYRLNNC